MKCPYCNTANKSRVVDTTRGVQGGIRRRRECKTCERRFSTYEKVLRATPLLIKGNDDREAFDRDKLIRGIQISCAKRPIPASGINNLATQIETHLQQLGQEEVSSRIVGDMVIEGLKALDPIAYIRYAIVYLGLDSLTSVQKLLDSLLTDSGTTTPTKVGTSPPSAKGKSASSGDVESTKPPDSKPPETKAGHTPS